MAHSDDDYNGMCIRPHQIESVSKRMPRIFSFHPVCVSLYLNVGVVCEYKLWRPTTVYMGEKCLEAGHRQKGEEPRRFLLGKKKNGP